ncbi:MAG TPA: hypothetical protein VI039_03225 [Solirubrobacterales bacterium]
MQKLLLTLAIALLGLATVTVPAQALSLQLPVAPFVADEEADEAEEPEDDSESGPDESDPAIEEECEEDEEGLCEEEAEPAEECAIEDATAKVSASPGNNSVALLVRYKASAPTSVAIDARLRGGKGGLHLGAGHTRFRRAGTFRDSSVLGEKRMDRVLAAREFLIELREVNAPRYCSVELNGALRRAKRSLRAGASDQSGGRGQTRGK